MLGKPVAINIVEVKAPELDAQLVAESIAQRLEKRISFRRAMKMSIGNAMRRGAKGIKIMCSGRLGGAEIARSSSTTKVLFRFGHFVQTSTTALQKLTQPMVK